MIAENSLRSAVPLLVNTGTEVFHRTSFLDLGCAGTDYHELQSVNRSRSRGGLWRESPPEVIKKSLIQIPSLEYRSPLSLSVDFFPRSLLLSHQMRPTMSILQMLRKKIRI